MNLRARLLLVILTAPIAALGAPASPEPLAWGVKAASRHAPYATGDCAACHDKKGPHPGPPPGSIEQLCFSCHGELRAADHRGHAFRNCTRCHNAHDSKNLHLLRADPGACPECHRMNATGPVRVRLQAG